MKRTLTNKEEMLMNIFGKHGSMFFRDLVAHLILIPLLAVCVLACNPAKKNKTPNPTAGTTPEVVQETAPEAIPYQLVEQKPSFQGGDANDFAKWVNDHLTWPEEAKDIDAQGRVTLQFTVATDGSIVNAKVLRGLHPVLDEEALRVVNSSTKKWTPGIQNGQPVPVVYTFPVIFRLK
jgi:TonB family protein